MKKKLTGMLLAGWILGMPNTMAAPSIPGAGADAGVQLNQTMDYLERMRVQQQIEDDIARNGAQIEGVEAPAPSEQDMDISFQLNRLETDPSQVLTDAELDAIAADYIGKKVTVSDLYKIVDRINELYTNKGFLTCRAFLQPQTIEGGHVKITLIEGKTGTEKVINNQSTKEEYITNRLHLREGEVANINTLNKDLLLFNATNDVQLRIVMEPGKQEGTTDYIIEAYEPKRENWTLFTDNAGSYSTGEWRGGLFYNQRSLTKIRDSLTLGLIGSNGTNAGSLLYSRPVGRSGAKLNFSYSSNGVKQTRNNALTEVNGHASSFSLGYVQPLAINTKLRTELSLDYNHQQSASDFLVHNSDVRFNIANDTIDDVSIGFAMTNYGTSHVFYQKHSLVLGRSKSSPAAFPSFSKSYQYYKLTGLYQKSYKGGQLLSSRLDAQWSGRDNIVSARQFFIGGMNSVRGYKENYMGGDSGIFWNLEYSVPLTKDRKTSSYFFFDMGRIFGESAESNGEDRDLSSIGFGVKSTAWKNTYVNLSLGIPLKRNFAAKAEKVSSFRVNFMVSYQF